MERVFELEPILDDTALMLISVVIAEDHAVTCEGFRSILEENMEARVVATTANGRDVLPVLRKHDPDLLLLDLSLPGLNGLDVLRQLQERDFSTPVVVVSMQSEETYVCEALRNGASAYVLKGSPVNEFVNAVRAAVNGKRYLSEELPPSLLDTSPSTEAFHGGYSSLTKREREVLHLLSEGLTSKEIGDRLCISPRTVDKHRENLKEKLGVRNAVEAVRIFFRHNPPTVGENSPDSVSP